MAGKREIKTQLKLEGEQQFKKGMADAASAIKELNSEQKLAEAQFEATGDAEQYAAEQTRILKEKIEQQQRAVNAAEKAVQSMKEQGIDPNSKAVRTWRTKLNNAKTALTRMEKELGNTEDALNGQGNAFDDTTTDAGEYKDKLDEIAKGVDFSATITAIDNVRERLGTIIKAAAKAGKAMWDMEVDAGAWADEISTAAQVADMDVETYQAWLYASRFVDTSVDSIIGSYKRLNKNLEKPSDDILKSLNELSVANLDKTTGKARETTEVFWDVVDALGKVESKSRREQLAMDLLGKSYDDLYPLIRAGSKAFLGYAEEGKDVAVVSEANVKALTSLDDANQKLDASFQKTKYTLLAQIAPAFEKISRVLQSALDRFDAFMQTEEGKEALESLNEAIEGIAETVSSIDFTEGMEHAKNLINGVTEGLKWVANHGNTVVGIIGAMGGAWAALTVSRDVLSVLQLMNSIKWAQISKVAASGAGGASGAGKAAAAAGKAAAGGGMGLGGFAGLTFVGATIYGAAKERIARGYARGDVQGIKDSIGQSKDLEKAFTEYVEANRERQQLFDEGIIDGEETAKAIQRVTDASAALRSLEGWEEVLDAYRAWREVNSLGSADWQLPEDMAASISAQAGLPVQAASDMAANVEAAADTVDATTIGYNVSAGLAQGIYDGYDLAVGAAVSMGDAVSGALSRVLMIKSPSRVMMRLGEYVSEGFAEGIENNIASVERATNRMVKATTAGVSGDSGQPNGAAGGQMVHITIQVDGQDMADIITPYVDSNIGALIQQRR